MYPHIEAIQSFVDGMIERVNSQPDLRNIFGLSDEPTRWLKDFKTIGFQAPRQCGAQFWMHNDFLKHDDAILVVPNQTVRECLRDSFQFNREYIQIGQQGDDTSLPVSVVRRILTQQELADYIRQDYDIFNLALSRIYIQNTTAFFKAVRREKFYNWLANTVKFDGFIICNDVV